MESAVEHGINGDQPTNFVRYSYSTIIDVAGTNSDAGATDSDVSDDVEDSRYGSEFSDDEEDERCSCDSCNGSDDDEDGSEVWYEEGDKCGPGIWDDDDDEEEEDLDKNSEDEDSNYASSQQNTSEAPFKKRAKTDQTVEASPSKMVKRKINLSLLPTMPLDVLFEIFSHLSPMDIVSLSHTSKVFHETLSSRNTLAVWKAARKRFSAPDGPDWISEEAWADLLFGHKCQSCGKSNVRTVDFLLLRRICASCKRRHYVSRSKVVKRYPDFDFVILLVPFTNISPWICWNCSSNYYWNLDVDSMVSKLGALKKDNSSQLKCFMEERKLRVQYIGQNSSSWRKWYEQMQLDHAQETKDIEEKRLQQIKEKFKELGYIEEDLCLLRSKKEYRGPGKTQLTAKIWSRIRPILEPIVKEQKSRRLERELAIIKGERRRVLAAQYKEYQRTLHSSQWKYLPRTLEIAAFESFSRHIEAVGVEVDGTTFDNAFLELPNLLSAATERRKGTLRALMGDTPREDGEIGADSIDLATAVFKCVEVHTSPRPFIYVFGWDEIASHHCLPEMEGTEYRPGSALRTAPLELKYIPEIAITIRKLAQLIGLDSATATAADFDEKNKRFTCDACCWSKQDGRYSKVGYTWRNLAVHLETSKTHNPNLHITVLSDNAAEEVKQCERNDHKWNANLWTCSHCPEFIDNLQDRQSIVKHLSDSHGIQVPSEPTDYFFFERCRRDWATKPTFWTSAPIYKKFRCLVCAPNSKRLFMLNGVESHLRAKHSISSVQDGVHYAPA